MTLRAAIRAKQVSPHYKSSKPNCGTPSSFVLREERHNDRLQGLMTIHAAGLVVRPFFNGARVLARLFARFCSRPLEPFIDIPRESDESLAKALLGLHANRIVVEHLTEQHEECVKVSAV